MKQFQTVIHYSVVIILLVFYPLTAKSDSCDPRVREILTQQQATYVGQVTGLANQNFSRRSNSFALSTCLEKLMQSSGSNLLFKPPTFQSLFDQVTDLVCTQAEDLFSQFEVDFQLNDGSPVNSILGEINLSGQFNSIDQNRLHTSSNSNDSIQINAEIGGLFQ